MLGDSVPWCWALLFVGMGLAIVPVFTGIAKIICSGGNYFLVIGIEVLGESE